MLYTTFSINGKEYKARLNARACVDLEKKLGTNPINVFVKIGKDEMVPSLEDMITILHASLQAYEHGITIEKTYEIYDEFVDAGHNLMDLVPVIIEIFKVSGLIPEGVEDKETEAKNA